MLRISITIFSLLVCLTTACLRAEESRSAIRNVLFIVSDDLRANTLGCYGDKICRTPNIDRLAREGMLFERAYCQGTVCGPSRTSFMFSRYKGKGRVSEARGEEDSRNAVTLGQHFKDHGWYSARVGKIFHMRVPGDIIAGTNGQDVAECWTERFNSQGNEAHTPGDYACLNLNIFTRELAGRQSTRMPHRMFVSVEYDGDGSDQPDHKTASQTIELLRKHGDQPFFIAAGFVRPHYPMVAPRQYFAPYPWQDMLLPEQVEGDLDDIPKLGLPGSRSSTTGIDKYPDNQRRMWAAYYAAVTFMDAQVGRILDELRRLGLRDTTAVVFTSDHGYHLGDHTFWLKGNVHEQVTRVPLILSVPGHASGRSESIVELVDLYPTLATLAGLQVPPRVQGVSLVPVLKDPSVEVKPGALSFAKGHSWRTKDWAYMRYTDGSEELYDMRTDHGQFTNLAGQAEHAGTVKQMAAGLDARLRSAGLK